MTCCCRGWHINRTYCSERKSIKVPVAFIEIAFTIFTLPAAVLFIVPNRKQHPRRLPPSTRHPSFPMAFARHFQMCHFISTLPHTFHFLSCRHSLWPWIMLMAINWGGKSSLSRNYFRWALECNWSEIVLRCVVTDDGDDSHPLHRRTD